MQAKFADTEHKAATAQKAKIDAVAEERKFFEGAQRNLATNPSNENVMAWAQDAQLSPVLSAETKARAKAEEQKLLAMKPAQRAEYLGAQGSTASDITSRGQLKVSQGQLAVSQGQLKVAQDREARAATGAELKPVPVHAQKAITGAASSLGQLNAAIAALEANPDAVGWKGLTPDFALNRADPEGTVARAKLSNIGSLKIHERSGAAVTAAETPRLKPFIPSISDDYETALKKLKDLRDIQMAEQEVLTGTYNKDQGFREFTAPEPTGAAPAKPATPAAVTNVVTLPNGSSMTFPNAKAAAEFKKKAGL